MISSKAEVLSSPPLIPLLPGGPVLPTSPGSPWIPGFPRGPSSPFSPISHLALIPCSPCNPFGTLIIIGSILLALLFLGGKYEPKISSVLYSLIGILISLLFNLNLKLDSYELSSLIKIIGPISPSFPLIPSGTSTYTFLKLAEIPVGWYLPNSFLFLSIKIIGPLSIPSLPLIPILPFLPVLPISPFKPSSPV